MNYHHHAHTGLLAISQTFPGLSLSLEKGNCIAGLCLRDSSAGWSVGYSPQLGRAGSWVLTAKRCTLTRAQQSPGQGPAEPGRAAGSPRAPLALLPQPLARPERAR